jgi:poly(3-hydroxybutyrate) depolymerase
MTRRAGAVLFCLVAVTAWAGRSRGQSSDEIAAARGEVLGLLKSRPGAVPEGTVLSISHDLDVAARLRAKESQGDNARRYYDRAVAAIAEAKAGRDPLAARRGFVERAYRSEISTELQPYSIYVPDDYDPTRPTPLFVVLHGGSSNHNLFLGVVFGNNLDWETYSQHLYDRFEPRFETSWLVVAPNGFGQVMWRWMGEQDVLDVIEDVQRHYNVDPDQIVLNGVSNGGVGSYSIGGRHAWRFAAVLPMAGASSWRQYLHGAGSAIDDRLISAFGAWDSADNLRNLKLFKFYHGNADTGPMRPHFPIEFGAHLDKVGVPYQYKEFDLGHDIMYAVHRRMKVLKEIEAVRRDPRPRKVWLVAWDYRARRQHWLQVEHFIDFAQSARVVGEVADDGRRLAIDARNVDELLVRLRECPIAPSGDVQVVVDGVAVTTLGPDRPEQLTLSRQGFRWVLGPRPPAAPGELRKRPGMSGPLTDVLHTCQVHVYGTGVEDDAETLEKAARRGATGQWTQLAWDYTHPVVADSAVTDEMIASCSLVLYGDPRSNSLLAKVADRLPIKIEPGAISLGSRRFDGKTVGTRFIYPNPLAPDRYLVVQAGTTPGAVLAGNNLPDFLPDYVVYDDTVTSKRARGVFRRGAGPIAEGFFDDRWRLPPDPAAR